MKKVRFVEFKKRVEESEKKYWLPEFIYFKALENLEDIQADLNKLEQAHVEEIIRIFLINWGRMGRTVERKGTEWSKLTEQLRNSNEFFQKLRGLDFLDIKFNEEVISAIKGVYESAKVKNIGPTAISKVLHLLNPELFVMWDADIRDEYGVKGSANGYIEFLKKMQNEIDEALEEEAKNRGYSKGEVARKICKELTSEKLSREFIKKKTLAKLIDEYNWMLCHQG